MTRALVAYESMFGNTETIARAIARGISTQLPVDVVPVTAAPAIIGEQISLLVVGGPTHAFGMSRARTRKAATEQGAVVEVGIELGVREWTDKLRRSSAATATFDTRIKKRGVPGSAARGLEKRLRRSGFPIEAAAISFYVESTSGPLLVGEEQRAQEWGTRLASRFAPATPDLPRSPDSR